jgi:hypothetical protein
MLGRWLDTWQAERQVINLPDLPVDQLVENPFMSTPGRSVISVASSKDAEIALKMMLRNRRNLGKIVLPCRPKFPRRDKSFFQGRFGADSIFVQAIRWTPI